MLDVEAFLGAALALLAALTTARWLEWVPGQLWVPTALLSDAPSSPIPCPDSLGACPSASIPPLDWDGRAWLDPARLLPARDRSTYARVYTAQSLVQIMASGALLMCGVLSVGASFLTAQPYRVRVLRALSLVFFMAAFATYLGASHEFGNLDIVIYSGNGYVFASTAIFLRWAFLQPCIKPIVTAALESALAADNISSPGTTQRLATLFRVNVKDFGVMAVALVILAIVRTAHSPAVRLLSAILCVGGIGVWATTFLPFWLQKRVDGGAEVQAPMSARSSDGTPNDSVISTPQAHSTDEVLLGRRLAASSAGLQSATQLPESLLSSRAFAFMHVLERMTAVCISMVLLSEVIYECGLFAPYSPMLHCLVSVGEAFTYTLSPMMNVFYVVLASDERSLLQEKLSLARAQAASELAASTSIRRYLRYTSHELRVPMQGIVLGLHTLARVVVDDPDWRECVDMMTSACDSMQTIMNSVLTLSAIEAGKFTLSYSTSSMRRLVHNAMQSLRLWASEANINLTSHVSPDVPSLMRMDAQRLQQVCANLLSNAIKFVPHDGSGCVSLTVSVLPHATGPAHTCAPTSPCVVVRVAVCDNGVGISEEEQRKLFTAFHQIGSHVKSYASTGLGLAIAHEIVRLHGGVIHCTSSGVAGAGSMFAMDIPFMVCEGNDDPAVVTETPVPVATHVPATTAAATAAATATTIAGASGVHSETTEARRDSAANGAALPAAQSATTPSAGIAAEPGVPATQAETRVHAAAEVAPSTASSVATSAAEATTPSLRFLVVDDSKLNRRMLATMCSRLYKNSLVQEACDGAQAVEMVTAQQAAHSRSRPYDVICMDRDMPRMSGDDATRTIRAQGCVCAMVGVTGNALEEDTRVFMEAGLNSVLIKPIAPDALRSTLDAALAASSRDSDALHAMTGE